MLTRGHLADAIVRWFARSLSISEMEADLLYFKLVTVNMQFILALVIIIFVFLLFRMLLDTYKRYFDEVVTGIDKLMEERAAISLSPELESVEHKLADVKRTLAERADKAKRAEQQKNDLVVYTGGDRGKCNPLHSIFQGQQKGIPVAGGKLLLLPACAAVPHRTHGVDNIPAFQVVGLCNLGLSCLAAAQQPAFMQQFLSRGPVDSPIHPSSSKEG